MISINGTNSEYSYNNNNSVKIAQATAQPLGSSGNDSSIVPNQTAGNTETPTNTGNPLLPASLQLPSTSITSQQNGMFSDGNTTFNSSSSANTLITPTTLPNYRFLLQQDETIDNVNGINSSTTNMNLSITAQQGSVVLGKKRTQIDPQSVPLNTVALPEEGGIEALKFTTMKEGKLLDLYFAGTSLPKKLAEKMKEAGELEIKPADIYQTGEGEYTVKLRFAGKTPKDPSQMITAKFTTQKPTN